MKTQENWKQESRRKDRCVSGDRFSGEGEKAYVQKCLWSIIEMEFLSCTLRLLTLTFCERYHIMLQRTRTHTNNTLHILQRDKACSCVFSDKHNDTVGFRLQEMLSPYHHLITDLLNQSVVIVKKNYLSVCGFCSDFAITGIHDYSNAHMLTSMP